MSPVSRLLRNSTLSRLEEAWVHRLTQLQSTLLSSPWPLPRSSQGWQPSARPARAVRAWGCGGKKGKRTG